MPFWSRWFSTATPKAPATVPPEPEGPAEPQGPAAPGGQAEPQGPEGPAGTVTTAVAVALDRFSAAVPEVAFALRPAVSAEQLQNAEDELGFTLPDDVRDLYLTHDGQPTTAPGLLGGMPLLPLAAAMEEWRGWQSVGQEYATEFDSVSFTPGAVREVYVDPGWFPLSTDFGGNNLGVDCDPGPAGTRGQLINFGRDEEVKFVYAVSVSGFLSRLAELAEAGRAVVDGDSEETRWGIDDADSPWPHYPDFDLHPRDAAADVVWFEALEPAWQERIGGPERVPAFLAATTFSSFARDTVLPRVSSLQPLARATNLREVLIHTRVLDDLTELPALPLLQRLIVHTRSHVGIERFPALAEYWVLAKTTAADLSPLAAMGNLGVLRLLGPHPDLGPLQGCSALTELDVRLAGADQLLEVGRLTGLRRLTLDLRDVPQPVDQLDWSGLAELRRLNLQLGSADTLDFLDELPNLVELTVSDAVRVDVLAVGRMPRVQSLTLRSPENLRNVADIAAATTLRSFSGGFAAFDVLKDLRPDLPFTSMEGDMTDEEHDRWTAWLDRPASPSIP